MTLRNPGTWSATSSSKGVGVEEPGLAVDGDANTAFSGTYFVTYTNNVVDGTARRMRRRRKRWLSHGSVSLTTRIDTTVWLMVDLGAPVAAVRAVVLTAE